MVLIRISGRRQIIFHKQKGKTDMITLEESRTQIDRIDRELTRLMEERMRTAGDIAAYKKEHGLPVLDASRERSKLRQIAGMTDELYRDDILQLYGVILELSKSFQSRILGTDDSLVQKIRQSIENTAQLFPSDASVACQGLEGSNSQIACDRLVRHANIMYFSSFDAVFSAVEKGLCRYGMIPVENSTAGSVNAVYDLMQQHQFYIARSIRLKVDHNLLALPGTRTEEIREIYSHEQALSQCSRFLHDLKGVKLVPCENTAVAARMVAESGRKDIAALASRACSGIYGLQILKESVQNQSNNYTRFICISKQLEIYPGADRTSLILTLPHEQGSLYKVMSRLYTLGINLNKLESRPIPDRDFEFRFYFDLDVPVYSPKLLQLMGEIGTICESFTYLGSYSEMV